jgi:hypothetical protein
MRFIDFPYSNLRLDPAAGDEKTVYTMRAYGGPSGITACVELDPEDLEMIQKTGCIWVHVCGSNWAPMSVHSTVPALNPGLNGLRVFGDVLPRLVMEDKEGHSFGVIHYLDLSFVYIKAPENRCLFRWKTIRPDADQAKAFGIDAGAEIYDLEYEEIEPGEKMPSGQVNAFTYLFSQPLEFLGRLRDLPRLHPMKIIHPFLSDDMLIFLPKDKPKAKLISLAKH